MWNMTLLCTYLCKAAPLHIDNFKNVWYLPPIMWIEQKYISILSSSVRNFKKKQTNLWTFSCPICGDSIKDKRKTRGYIYLKDRAYRYACHNCGVGMHFSKFLETVNPNLYKDYRFEKFRDTSPEFVEYVEKKEEFAVLQKTALEKIARKVSTLEDDHPAILYLKSRKIDPIWFTRLFHTENMNDFSTIFPKYKEIKFMKEGRIVIPIYNRKSELVGVTARAYQPSNLRYIMMRRDDNEPLIFNLDRIDINKRVYALEGAFDAMFVKNAVAVDGADFSKLSEVIPKSQTVVVFDNQPRNQILLKRIDNIANEGYAMVVWPDGLEKDINKNIIDGKLNTDEIMPLLEQNTFSGMKLRLKLSNWKKINTNARNFSQSY